ncbi:LysR family transcriptional regulator [Dactylosporangium sp. NPDC051541]|uniref:LysR family transcriptional regulator n=1 Tax=Dactylosporangium sp. NPDC051541 TaxID=3363977 RepID=UPI00378761C9
MKPDLTIAEAGLERHELETFLALAAELHFGRTAARLGRTTARVSQIIRVLERRIGVPLFERTSRRVALTPTGRRLYADLRPAHEQITAALSRAMTDARGVTGVVRVGFVGALTGRLGIRAAEHFRRSHPDCEVRLHEVQSGAAADRLRSDEIDMLLGCFPIDGPDLITGQPLLSEPRMLAVAAHHPYAARPTVSLQDLARSRMVVAPCSLPTLTPTGPHPTGPVAETFQEALTLVGAGQGAFVVGRHATRFYARPDVTYVPIQDAPPLHWGPIWHKTRATARVHAFAAAAASGSTRLI